MAFFLFNIALGIEIVTENIKTLRICVALSNAA